jgi:hypothetical protein
MKSISFFVRFLSVQRSKIPVALKPAPPFLTPQSLFAINREHSALSPMPTINLFRGEQP